MQKKTVAAASLALCLGLGACSPALNWREVRHDGLPMKGLMPCKPDRAEREVPLLGMDRDAVKLYMLSCDAEGMKFAFAAARIQDSTLSSQALSQWRRATWASLGQQAGAEDGAPPGWLRMGGHEMPAGWGERWSGPASAHDGRPLRADLMQAAKGDWVVQLAVYGERPQAEALDTFFSSYRFE